MRILISSNGIHTTTGYGTQAKLLAKTLQAQGHEVRVHAWYGLAGGAAMLDGIICYPRVIDPFGGDTAVIAKHFEAELVITIQDLWPLPENYGDMLPCPWAAWVPMDGHPLDPDTKLRLAQCAYPIAMSEFGQEVMAEAGISSTYIPHGVDPVFEPVANREQLRQQLGIPEDAYVVVVVATNKGYPSRKSLPEILAAFKQFHDEVEEAVLYLHTMLQPGGEVGLDLLEIMRMLGLDETAVKYTNQYQLMLGIDSGFIAQLYNTADVLFAPSAGEGFGLPILEAQCCGTPVITQACSSMTELTWYGQAVVAGQQVYNAVGRFHYTPKISRLVDALHHVKEECPPGNLEVSERLRDAYGWERLGKDWAQLLARIKDETVRPAELEEVESATA